MKLKTKYVTVVFTPGSIHEYEYKTRLYIKVGNHVVVSNNPYDNEFAFKIAKVVKVNKKASFTGVVKDIICKVQNTDIL